MLLHLTELSHLPMHEQIVNQIIFRIVNNDLQAGNELEAVGNFSRKHHLNKNTVEKAYKNLQQKGLINLDNKINELSGRQKQAIRKHRRLMSELEFGNYIEALERYQFEEELKTARQLQQELVSAELPAHNAFSFAARSKPCSALGGDLYEVIPIDINRVAFLVADVSGHGIPTAILAAQMQAILRSDTAKKMAIAEMIGDLNRYLYAYQPAKKFATLFFGILNTLNGTLEYINAGHNHPILIRKNEDVERLATTGPALGLMADSTFGCGKLTIEKDDLLVLYTDGLTEIMNCNDAEYSEQRFIEVLKAKHHSPLSGIIKKLLADIENYTGLTTPQDDQTLLLLKHK